MTFDPNEVLDFDFTGVEPAVFGDWRALPKGEYNAQCIGVRKYFTGESKGKPDPNKPNLLFEFVILNHPDFTGREFKDFKGLSHSLSEAGKPFLLNTLQALMPERDWQQGIKITLADLIQTATGRAVNLVIEWEINAGSGDNAGKRYVNNNIKFCKKYDASIPQPVASEGNPPVLTNDSANTSPVAQAAAAGVPASEVDSFLSSIPGGTPQVAPVSNFDFGDEPF